MEVKYSKIVLILFYLVKLEVIEDKNKQLLKKLIDISTAKNKHSLNKHTILINSNRH